MRSRRAALLAVAIAGVGCGGRSGAARTPALSAQAPADPVAQVLAFVPPDASFVFVRDQQAGLTDRFSNPEQTLSAVRGVRAILDPAAGPGTAFGAALLDALVDPARTAADVLGWREGQSVLAVYGLGVDTVVRAALDGARLRATLEHAATASHFPLAEVRWQDRPYYRIEIPTPAFSIWLLVRIDDHGVVAAITGDPDRLLEHVMAERPTGPRFDTAAVVTATYPDRPDDARFSAALYPARLAAALRPIVARKPAWLAAVGDCSTAAVALLEVTPAMSVGWVPTRGRFQAVAALDVSAGTIDRLVRDQRAIPRWPANDDGLEVGLGVQARTLVDVLEPWLTAFDRMTGACGNPTDVMASARAMLAPAPIAHLDAVVISWHARTRTTAMAVGTRDLAALWAGLRTLMPLRPQPPAPLEQLALPGLVVMGAADALGIGAGERAAEEVTELLAAPAGPREVLAFHFGRDFMDEARRGAHTLPADVGTMDLHLRVRDRRLLLEMAATVGSGRAPLAH